MTVKYNKINHGLQKCKKKIEELLKYLKLKSYLEPTKLFQKCSKNSPKKEAVNIYVQQNTKSKLLAPKN